MDINEIYSIKNMNQIKQALTSRTVWTVVALIIINGVPAVTGMLPEGSVPFVNAALGLLSMYFKVNPSQTYGPTRY